MLPITLKTGDPVKGWEAGLVWSSSKVSF